MMSVSFTAPRATMALRPVRVQRYRSLVILCALNPLARLFGDSATDWTTAPVPNQSTYSAWCRLAARPDSFITNWCKKCLQGGTCCCLRPGQQVLRPQRTLSSMSGVSRCRFITSDFCFFDYFVCPNHLWTCLGDWWSSHYPRIYKTRDCVQLVRLSFASYPTLSCKIVWFKIIEPP